MPKPSRTAVVAFSSLSAVGLLAGCAAGTTETAAPTAEAGSNAAVESSPPIAGPGQTGFADGTYTAEGAYLAPSGPESVTVTVTVAADAVAAVEVVGHARDPQAKEHQAEFIGGIASAVVGKPLAGLAVDRVAGSSLTGKGFNAALDAIRADAAS